MKMKRIKVWKKATAFVVTFILLFTVSVSGINAAGQRANQDSLRAAAQKGFIIKNGVLVKYTGSENVDVVIPNGVTRIGPLAFSDYDDIYSVKMPNSVTSIGYSAFANCYNLKSITLSKNLKAIESGSFSDCLNLRSISLPGSLTKIADFAFARCISLKSVTIPDKIRNIEDCTFEGCSSLTNIILPKSIKTIGESAFRECESLKSVEIPDGVTSIGPQAFFQNTSLRKIVIPRTVISIGSSAFDDTIWLDNKRSSSDNSLVIVNDILVDGLYAEGDIVVPSNIKYITPGAFNSNEYIQSIEIPTGVSEIGAWTFAYCYDLNNVTLPEGIVSIGESAFEQCVNLSTINLPESIAHVGKDAFMDTVWLAEQRKTVSLVTINKVLIDGKNAKGALTIPDNILYISENAFYKNKKITSVNIPENIKLIEAATFGGCTALSKVSMTDNVTYIGNYAFSQCSKLENINISSKVREMGVSVFENCKSLKKVKIPYGVTDLGVCTFEMCSNLNYIEIPATIKDMGYGMFEGCPKLTIYGDPGTHAHSYAYEYGIPFNTINGVKELIGNCTASINPTTCTFSGKSLKPAVTVKFKNMLLKNGSDYTVSYKNNINVGTGSVIITGKGIYSGRLVKEFKIKKANQSIKYTKSYNKSYGDKAFSVYAKHITGNGKFTYKSSDKKIASVDSKGRVSIKGIGYAVITVSTAATANYNTKSINISIRVIPKKGVISKTKAGKRKLAVRWKRDSKVTGYQLQYSKYRNFKKGVKTLNISKNSTIGKTLTKLSKGKYYYVRVRSYKTVKQSSKKKILYGAWSSAKKSTKIK